MDLDPWFDFRTDKPPGKDPDTWSPVLQAYHCRLWSKPLPSGAMFDLTPAGRRGRYRLVHDSGLGRFELSSDAITTRLLKSPIAKSLGDEERPTTSAYTIGSALVFPCRRVDRKQTINQRRGTHPRIRDRFDLTLECIRRHYLGQESPLEDLLLRYDDFFALFGDFAGYVDFFLLQDLLETDGSIRFLHRWVDFTTPALPATREDYLAYLANSNAFIRARNERIAAWVAAQDGVRA